MTVAEKKTEDHHKATNPPEHARSSEHKPADPKAAEHKTESLTLSNPVSSAKAAKRVKLYHTTCRNEPCSVGTQQVYFDKHGFAEVDNVTEEDMALFAALRWLDLPSEPPPKTVDALADKKLSAMPRQQVMLRSLALKGDKCNTPFGLVEFDEEGYATWNASQEELAVFQALRWEVSEIKSFVLPGVTPKADPKKP
jgi:hypothetical protein